MFSRLFLCCLGLTKQKQVQDSWQVVMVNFTMSVTLLLLMLTFCESVECRFTTTSTSTTSTTIYSPQWKTRLMAFSSVEPSPAFKPLSAFLFPKFSSSRIHHVWKRRIDTTTAFVSKKKIVKPLLNSLQDCNGEDTEGVKGTQNSNNAEVNEATFSRSLDKESHQQLSTLLDNLNLLDDPTIEDYNTVLKECSKKEGKQYMETCMWLLEELIEVGLSPNLDSYLLTLNACKLNNEYEEAMSLLREMKQNEDSSCQPNLEAYTLVIESLHEANISGQIRWLIDEMEVREIQPDLKVYNLAIEAAASTFDVFRARREKLDVPSDEDSNAEETDKISGQEKTAGESSSSKENQKDELYERLSLKLREVGHNFVDAQVDEDIARSLFYDMERKGIEPDVNSYKFLLAAYTKQGIPAYMTRAQDIITEMTLQKGLHPNEECYAFLVEGYAQLGEEYAGQRDACKQMMAMLSGQTSSEAQINRP